MLQHCLAERAERPIRSTGRRAMTPTRSRPRIALYSHDTVGLGHLRRNLLIAETLAAPPVEASVLVVAGSAEANVFARPRGVDYLTLPGISKEFAGYEARSLDVSLHELVRLRGQTIRAALDGFEPDLFIVDKVPRGAIAELNPTLRELRRRGRTFCVLGLRDVLDEPEAVRREWEALRNEEAIHDFYDAIWVYGDPNVYDPVREYGLSVEVAKKVRYLGYFDRPGSDKPGELRAPRRRNSPIPEERFVLCTVGGGQDGAALALAFASARLPDGLHGVLLTGPFMPEEIRRDLHRLEAKQSRLHVIDLTNEPTELVRRAERVIAMAGYNTACELVSLEKPTLFVPRVEPRREQWIRAERFAQLGLADICLPSELTPARIEAWLAGPAPRPDRSRIDFSGRERIRDLVLELLPPCAPERRILAT
jgi:predicted glycosyltransferase